MNSREKNSSDLIRYFDGTLNEAETKALSERLAGDSDLRAEFREVAEQAVHLGDIGRAHQVEAVSPRVVAGPIAPVSRFRFGRGVGLAAAAAIALLAGAAWWVMNSPSAPQPIATLEAADGKVRWTDRDGRLVEDLTAGMQLGAGSLSVASADGTVQIRFPDDTVLTFGGETDVQLSERDERKWVVLDRGTVTAEVSEQPSGAPLTLVTPTAEIEVLGTILSVSADPSETALSVDEGLVAIRNLLNGERVEVPAGQQIVASLDSQLPMKAVETGELPSHWKLNPDDPAGNLVTKGEWIEGDGERFLRSVPYVASRDHEGGALIRNGVAINGPVRMGTPYVQLGPDSVIRVRCRLEGERSAGVSVFLGTRRGDGGFGGNHTFEFKADAGSGSNGEFFEVVIPIAEFELARSFQGHSSRYTLEENALSKILISVSEDDDLHLESVSVENGRNL